MKKRKVPDKDVKPFERENDISETKFSKRLKTLREKLKKEGRNATRAEFGRLMGVTPQMVYKYEKGESEPGLEKVEALINHYRLPVSTFLDVLDEDEKPTISILPWDPTNNDIMDKLLEIKTKEQKKEFVKIPGAYPQIPVSKGLTGAVAFRITSDLYSPSILEGDIIVISVFDEPKDGDLLVMRAQYETGCAIRIMRHDKDHVVYSGLNPATPTIRIPADQTDKSVIIFGVIKELRREF